LICFAIALSTIDPLSVPPNNTLFILLWRSELVENAIFGLISTNKVVKFHSKRLGKGMVVWEGLFFSDNVPSTIDLLVAQPENPFITVVAAGVKN